MVRQFRREARIVERIRHGGDAQIVLGRRAHHARAADVDVRARHLGRPPRLGDRLPERVEVHHHHVNRLGVEALQVGLVRGIVRLAQEAEVDLEVERLHEAALHLRLARVGAHRDERIRRRRSEDVLHLRIGAARRIDLHARTCLHERRHERVEPGLVGYAHQHVPDGDARVNVLHNVQRHIRLLGKLRCRYSTKSDVLRQMQ